MELRATALYRHSQRDATAPHVRTQRYFLLRPALMGPPWGDPPYLVAATWYGGGGPLDGEAREGLGGLRLDEIEAASSFPMLPMA